MAQDVEAAGTDAYLDAFMHGFEFVLLAIRGRIMEAGLPLEERARLEGFLADYYRIAKAYREREGPKSSDALSETRVFKAEVTALLVN